MTSQLRLRGEGVVWREVAGEVIAVDVPYSLYLSANTSGALIWRQLAQGTTREELVDLLADRYGIDSERAAGDVDAFVGQLEERGLLA